ncbi:SanA/YdcF family protein [Salinivibrio sharmensis]|uniref:DUF218 domain-containing protein n=1 Tax=Salinivibrio sharmensis TaxID=390883 RepID=A0ABX3KG84_9GAMM|nr:ElyC/SanA/YdcF family protein [Salinivibrio sharmensis]OOE88153.1 hypothetical protein BZG74_09295 [Salinivibrio sharmensis]
MALRRRLRQTIFTLIGCTSVVVLIMAASDVAITLNAKGRVYQKVEELPAQQVGLVLGTSKYIGKTPNPYYTHRIDAAESLYQAGKIEHLLLSGDNAHRSYNEPWTMKRDLRQAGIPEDRIHLDYAGFRTLDSVVRAKTVFSLVRYTVISQQFHCERALFLADVNNIDAICYAVPSPQGWAGIKIRAREVLARTKAVLDSFILNVKPKFTGPKEPISGVSNSKD